MIPKYKILLNELISVSFRDEVIGPISKWDAHLNTYILSDKALPHRAFSIFLFNSLSIAIYHHLYINPSSYIFINQGEK